MIFFSRMIYSIFLQSNSVPLLNFDVICVAYGLFLPQPYKNRTLRIYDNLSLYLMNPIKIHYNNSNNVVNLHTLHPTLQCVRSFVITFWILKHTFYIIETINRHNICVFKHTASCVQVNS